MATQRNLTELAGIALVLAVPLGREAFEEGWDRLKDAATQFLEARSQRDQVDENVVANHPSPQNEDVEEASKSRAGHQDRRDPDPRGSTPPLRR